MHSRENGRYESIRISRPLYNSCTQNVLNIIVDEETELDKLGRSNMVKKLLLLLNQLPDKFGVSEIGHYSRHHRYEALSLEDEARRIRLGEIKKSNSQYTRVWNGKSAQSVR